MRPPAFRIAAVGTPEDLVTAVDPFRAFAAGLGIDLACQGLEADLAGLPGKHAPPAGALPLARDPGGAPTGWVALRPIGPGVCLSFARPLVRETAG